MEACALEARRHKTLNPPHADRWKALRSPLRRHRRHRENVHRSVWTRVHSVHNRLPRDFDLSSRNTSEKRTRLKSPLFPCHWPTSHPFVRQKKGGGVKFVKNVPDVRNREYFLKIQKQLKKHTYTHTHARTYINIIKYIYICTHRHKNRQQQFDQVKKSKKHWKHRHRRRELFFK